MKAEEWFNSCRQTMHKQLEQTKNALSLHDGEEIVNIEDITAAIELLRTMT